MKKHKFIKPLLIGVACTIPVGLVVGLSVNWDHTQYISAVGSSGVKPFIEKFGKTYHQSHKKFDVTVESGGTTFAVEELAKGYTTLGNASNNPYRIINEQGFLDRWDNKKTLTLGWEGLCLMYSLPDGLSSQTKNDFEIVITQDNILKLYGVFSCWHELKTEPWQEKYETLWYYAPQRVKDKITNKNDQQLLQQTKILPFVRAGGNTGANSSIAFSYYSNLANFEDMTDNQQKAFSGGQYGEDSDFMETDESNTRAWQSFVAKDKPGSMVYLTTSFLTNENNRQKIKDHGYKLAGYQYHNRSEVFINDVKDLKKIATVGGYNWYRPINVMIDLDVQKAMDFVYWIYFGSDQDMTEIRFAKQYEDFVYALGAKPLTPEQFKWMFNDVKPTIKESLFDKSATDLKIDEYRIEHQSEYPLFNITNIYGAMDVWSE